MKHRFLPLLSILPLLASCGNPSTDASASSEGEDPSHVQVILDNKFEHGFSCAPADGYRQDDGYIPDDRWTRDVNLKYGGDTTAPSWMMAQHGDIYSLCDKYNKAAGGVPTYEDGTYTFSDESKKVAVNPEKGSLYLELNTSKEYVRPRKKGEQWCHLLIEQGFTKAVRLAEVDSVDFTVDITMQKFEDHMEGMGNASDHCVQFLMYLVVKSEAALDANTFFWFGIPFFDSRYVNGLPESGMVDAGGAGATSKFLYQMATAEFLGSKFTVGEMQKVDVDLKPFFGQALIKAQSMGYFTNSKLGDLTFQSMNIGFEIPGTYDCGFEISNFALTANYSK